MALKTPTPCKDLAFGDLNPVQVPKRRSISDSQKRRNEKTDYSHSRDLRSNYSSRLAYTISATLEEYPYSWSLSARNFRNDSKLVVVTAVLIEETCSPSHDEEIQTLDGITVPQEFISNLHYQFIAVQPGLPVPSPGDIIRVDFQNRSSHTGPIYLGISESTNLGVEATQVSEGLLAELNPANAMATSLNQAPKTADEAKILERPITLISGMGTRRDIGAPGEISHHYGVDLNAPLNTPVFALFDGYIQTAYEQDGMAITIVTDDKRKIATYMHLNALAIDDTQHFRERPIGDLNANKGRSLGLSGKRIKKGQLIGITGFGGVPPKSDGKGGKGGPHLHLELEEIPPQFNTDENRTANDEFAIREKYFSPEKKAHYEQWKQTDRYRKFLELKNTEIPKDANESQEKEARKKQNEGITGIKKFERRFLRHPTADEIATIFRAPQVCVTRGNCTDTSYNGNVQAKQ